MKIFAVQSNAANNGSLYYTVINSVSKKIVCSTWKVEEEATRICTALNLYNDLVRSGLIDKVEKKIDEILLHNEQRGNPGT